jgi:membrane-associated protease RseP (regulator of RpoE activity)
MAQIVEAPDLDGRPAAPSKPEFIGAVGTGTLIAIAIGMIRSHAALVRVGKLAPALAICVIVHLTTFYVLARISGVTVEVVSYFFGGALIRFRRGETWFAFNWLPIGGGVKLKGLDGPAPAEAAAPDGWLRLSRIARAGFCLAGPLAVLGLGLAVLGWSQFRANLFHVPGQYRDLLTQAPAAVGGILYFVDHATFRDILGAAAVTMAVINLLPLPLVNGGQAIVQLVDPDPRSPWLARIQMVSLAIVIAMLLVLIYGGLGVAARR